MASADITVAVFSFSSILLLNKMQKESPVSATEIGWAVCMALIFAAYGKIDYKALAVVQVAEVVTTFFQCVYFGLGNAAAFIIGGCLGRNEIDRSFYFAKLTLKLTWILNLLMTGALLLMRSFIVSLYHFAPETNKLLYIALGLWAVIMIPKMLGYVMICGILRAGGDTVFALKVDLCLNIIEVILAYIGVLVFNFDLPKAVVFVYSVEAFKAIICHFRIFSKKWLNVVTDVNYD